MAAAPSSEGGLKVGLEVHQQLATRHKLFCACPTQGKAAQGPVVVRRLRPTQSELGEIDPAARYEFERGLEYRYIAPPELSCLVELDEEPPRELNREALEAALLVALRLRATVVDEVHVMRKIVIDGSNTTGFQRTAVIALGGWFEHAGRRIGVQTITLEEDSARLVEAGEGYRTFNLDRLGLPLVEVSLEPISGPPALVQEVALALGRILRSTRRVARGLGTIRQDLNISLGGGPVVEVKGVQQLELVGKVVDYEHRRQLWLRRLAQELRGMGFEERAKELRPLEVTPLVLGGSGPLAKAAGRGEPVFALPLPLLAGRLGRGPSPDLRLGLELADVARAFGLGGIIHSDELPGYGLEGGAVERIRAQLGLDARDGFLLLAGPQPRLFLALEALAKRVRALGEGVPAETRGPTPEGRTRYQRPRPGAARLYPETDIPPIPVPRAWLRELEAALPPGWEEEVARLRALYGLSAQLAEKLYDSDYLALFEALCAPRRLAPSFVASLLTDGLVTLRREGLPVQEVEETTLRELVSLVEQGRVAKEAALDLLRAKLKGGYATVQEALEALKIRPMGEEELKAHLRRLVDRNEEVIAQRGERALSALMGEAMAELRGRADGALVNSLLTRLLKEKLEQLGRSQKVKSK
ncbi:MAG: Glu-tRNA(Gln) amidotransferase GatDE subunit E [Nitrososphaerota archaeon]